MKYVQYLLNTHQFKQALQQSEKEIVLQCLKHCNYNETRAAKLLGVARGTLRSKLKQYQ